MAKILIVAGVPNWSMDSVCRGIAKHSKHDVTVTNYWIGGFTPSDWDGIYVHCGAVMSGEKKQFVLDHRHDTKWAVGIRGATAYKRNLRRLTHKLWDAYSCGSHYWIDVIKNGKFPSEVEGHVCHAAIDTTMFNPEPFPDEFAIGWAGNAANGAKRFRRFLSLPFKKRAVGGGFQFTNDDPNMASLEKIPRIRLDQMSGYYGGCSVYVNTSYLEGAPMPPKEASACGRPCVVTRCGDAPEWIPPEYIVDTSLRSFDRDKMIKLINRFKEDKDLLIEEGKRFKKLSERWDYRVVVKEYDTMFDGMLK